MAPKIVLLASLESNTSLFFYISDPQSTSYYFTLHACQSFTNHTPANHHSSLALVRLFPRHRIAWIASMDQGSFVRKAFM
jgi:hypothetical protein